MADKVEFNADGRAAVFVVDNQLGSMGIPAEVMNKLGTEMFKGVIEDHYDRVFVIVAHDSDSENNEVVKALKQAASQFGTVDMFVKMQTSMSGGKIAQVPFSAFDSVLTTEERRHLRLLYSMGCGDGNETSAIMAQQLGFKTFIGHKLDEPPSHLFAYPATEPFIAGPDVKFDGGNPKVKGMPRREAIDRLINEFVEIDRGKPHFGGTVAGEGDYAGRARGIVIEQALALSELGAMDELESLARMKDLPSEKRLTACFALMEKDSRYYSLFVELVKEPKSGWEQDIFGAWAGNFIGSILANADALWKITEGAPAGYLHSYSFNKLIQLGRLTADELKDFFYQRGRFTAAVYRRMLPLTVNALSQLMKDHRKEAIPVMKDVITDLNSHPLYFNAILEQITESHAYIIKDFEDEFYRLLADVDRFEALDEDSKMNQESERENRLSSLSSCDNNFFIYLVRRLVRESKNKRLVFAACIYLRDNGAMSAEEFASQMGFERGAVKKEGWPVEHFDSDVFSEIFYRFTDEYVITPEPRK